MTKERANKIGIIYTIIFGLIFSIPMIYVVSQSDFLEVFDIGIAFTWHYLDVFIPVILALSIYNGRFLGQKILIEKDNEGFFYCSQRLAFMSNFAHAITSILFLVYFLILGTITFNQLGFGVLIILMPGILFYLGNSIPFAAGGFMMSHILITYIGVSPLDSLKKAMKSLINSLLVFFGEIFIDFDL